MRRLTLAFVAPILVAVVAPSREAAACGGTFCDAGPMTAPVDQAQETVLFVHDGGFVEAHVQISVDPDTDAQQFAWVVPVPALPEFSVGSQPLFDALLAASAPRYDLRGESCWNESTAAFIAEPDGGAAGRDPEIQVENVGAFEVTVLDGGSVESVMGWLGDNGYVQDPAAEPILAEYLAQDFVLVAFRLIPSAGIGDVHPIVLRYPGDEPCVPLRLTAIAAQDDMAVRTLFLDEQRWAPLNYLHVVLNDLQLSWSGGGYDYAEAVTMAVDEATAGHAFVTEYAGPSAMVDDTQVYAPTWSSAPFVDAEPTTVIELLNAQDLADCTGVGPCIVAHPLVVAMLRSWLPAPEGVNPNDFYACLSCYADQTDFAAWDGPAFAAALDERVIAPGRHAVTLLESWPYLTRMFTTISAHEMTVDPTFQPAPDLLDVPLVDVGVRMCVEDCEGDAVATLPDGRRVYLDDGSWPSFVDIMPWAARVEQIPPVGAPIVELDNTAAIDAALAAYNAQFECMPPVGDTGAADEGDSGLPPGPGGTTTAGDGPTSGTETGSGENDANDASALARGCACTSNEAPGDGWLPLVVLIGLGARRRRG